MDIPISGLFIHSDGPGEEHSHKLFITMWDGRPIQPLHVHHFSGATSVDVGHRHHYAGITEPAATGVQHVHGYYAETSFDDGHVHYIRGTTGPSIPLPCGGHYHHFEGVTTVNGRTPHTHGYSGNTSDEIFE